jgi:hypothetical protein
MGLGYWEEDDEGSQGSEASRQTSKTKEKLKEETRLT